MSGTEKLTSKAKANFNRRLKAAFDNARARGVRYFILDGRSYNTRKKGETPAQWAKKFKDNATVAGSNRPQVSINYGWENGRHGFYNNRGQFIAYKKDDAKAPLGLRGQDRSGKGYAVMDGPESNPTVIGRGSLRGKARKRTEQDGSTIVIGQSPTGVNNNRPTTNAVANEKADDYVDRTVPDASDILSLPTAAVSAPVEMVLSRDYDVTHTSAYQGLSGRQADRSGYGWANPFGAAKNLGGIYHGHEAGLNGAIEQGIEGASMLTGLGAAVAPSLAPRLVNAPYYAKQYFYKTGQ